MVWIKYFEPFGRKVKKKKKIPAPNGSLLTENINIENIKFESISNFLDLSLK